MTVKLSSCQVIKYILCFTQIWIIIYFLYDSKNWNSSKTIRPKVTFEIRSSDAIQTCEYLEIGRFKIDPKFIEKRFEKSEIFTFKPFKPTECFKKCSSGEYSYTIITQKNVCVCSFDPFEVADGMVESNRCKNDSKRRCTNTMTLYRTSSSCTIGKNLTEEYASSRFIGCILRDSLSSFIKEDIILQNRVPDSKTCILFCGEINATLAVLDDAICICGKTTKILKYSSSFCDDGDHVKVYRTPVPDYRCELLKFLPPKDRPLVALSSFPGSGNTWARYLIEQASGIYTGSVYNDMNLVKIGYLGELVNFNRTPVIKDHSTIYHKGRPRYDKRIFLLRNPYNAILSELNRRHSTGHTDLAALEHFNGPEFVVHVKRMSSKWLKKLKELLDGKTPFLIVQFEELLKYPIETTRKMVKYVNFSHLRNNDLQDRLICLSQHIKGLAKRKSKKKNDPYTVELKNIINENIILADDALKEKKLSYDILSYIKTPHK